jgi:hypothetical protein
MNVALEKSLYHLTNQHTLNDVSVEQLTALANDHPYFAPAQFLLAAKMKLENNYAATEQLQKATLFSNNPIWVQHGIWNGIAKDIVVAHKDNTVATTNETIVIDTIPEVNTETKLSEETPSINVPTVESFTAFMQNIDSKNINNEEVYKSFGTTTPKEAVAFTSPLHLQNSPEVKNEIIEEANHFNHPDNIAAFDEQQSEKISAVLSSQVADFKKPVETNTQLNYTSEPLYTIDYFASQGIKFDFTKQPQDKLTLQLMKFTDWLKVFKNQPAHPTDLGTDPELEHAIQGIAQTSNQSKEIVTETMADVFVKQGKIDKAVQLYIKLSFLDPEKSSYFAAKIQELKGM